MAGGIGVEKGSGWASFMKKHWGIFTIFVIAVIAAGAGSVFVFLWFESNAQSSGLVPSTLGLWTMRNLVYFTLHAIFWELLLIGIPVAVAGIGGWLWWSRLPVEERYRFRRMSRRSRGGGGVSLFFFLAFIIKVYLDGNWKVPIATYTLDYVVGSMVLILELVLIICGIPAAIAAIWWFSRGMKKYTGTAV